MWLSDEYTFLRRIYEISVGIQTFTRLSKLLYVVRFVRDMDSAERELTLILICNIHFEFYTFLGYVTVN